MKILKWIKATGVRTVKTMAETALAIIGNTMNILSALYFAKPFAFKGVSPTVKQEDYNRKA